MQNHTQLRFLTQRAARIDDLPGIRIAVTLSTKSETLSWAAVRINPCSEKRVPPAKKHMPSTRSKFERIEPTTARRNQNSEPTKPEPIKRQKHTRTLHDAKLAFPDQEQQDGRRDRCQGKWSTHTRAMICRQAAASNENRVSAAFKSHDDTKATLEQRPRMEKQTYRNCQLNHVAHCSTMW